MLYTTFTVGGKEYKCKLNARAVMDLESKMGTNPLNKILAIVNKDEIPDITTTVSIIHASLQAYEHGITLSDTLDLYDKYIEEGHNIMDLITLLIDIFKVSGFMPEEDKKGKKKDSKN